MADSPPPVAQPDELSPLDYLLHRGESHPATRSAFLNLVEVNPDIRTFLDLPEARTHIYKRSGGKSLTVAELDAEIAKLFAAEHAREEVVA